MNRMLIVSTISALIFGLVICDEQRANVTTVRKCYVCTSAIHAACDDNYNGDNKFPHEKVNSMDFSRECSSPDLVPYYDAASGEKAKQAVGCRKILQEVDGVTRVVRQCAYNGSEDVNGLKRTGNEGVRLFYYQCSKDNCNTASSLSGGVVFMSLFIPLFSVLIARS